MEAVAQPSPSRSRSLLITLPDRNDVSMRLLIMPGHTQFTRTFVFATSSATLFVKPMIACLLAL